jgi:TolB protein
MKRIKIVALALVILFALTACSKQQEDNRTVIKEPDKSITVIDKEESDYEEPSVSVDMIYKPFNVVEITDWLDEQNLVVIMENKELEKMSLLERSDQYSRGIYLYNIETKEIKPLKVMANMLLGGAKLSPDKKHLLYRESSIGDSAYYVMNMKDEIQDENIKDEALGLAITADWTDDSKIIGVSYAGGAYLTDDKWDLIPSFDLQDEQLYTVVKKNNKVYYISIAEYFELYVLDLVTNETKKIEIENADGIIPSPDGEKLLITQSTKTGRKLHVTDMFGNILRTIAEGVEISGISWSPDQMLIAYQLRTVENGVDIRSLYVYDVLAEVSKKIEVNFSSAETVWSPSGDKLAVSQFSDASYINPSIIYFKK